jgi:hypothetical protein
MRDRLKGPLGFDAAFEAQEECTSFRKFMISLSDPISLNVFLALKFAINDRNAVWRAHFVLVMSLTE